MALYIPLVVQEDACLAFEFLCRLALDGKLMRWAVYCAVGVDVFGVSGWIRVIVPCEICDG